MTDGNSEDDGKIPDQSLPLIDMKEVALHNSEQSAWIILDNRVYDITKFLMEHPGGEEVLLQQSGQDATESFNDVGHSADARAMANDYLIGKLLRDEGSGNSKAPAASTENANQDTWKEILLSPTWSNFIIPVFISFGVFVAYKFCTRIFSRV